MHHSEMFNLLRSYLVIFDEYPVENPYRIDSSKTNAHDTVEKLKKKAKATFQSDLAQNNFKEYFTPPKKQQFTHNHLRILE